MSRVWGRRPVIGLIMAALACGAAAAATTAKTTPASSSPMLPGGNSKEPISIDADKLNYYDKEQKAIYTGNVVVIQGDSKLTCTVMTVFIAKAETPAAGAPAPVQPAAAPGAPDAGAAPGGTQVRHMDATGPVTIVSKTQVATGDRATYDKIQNKVWLFGNVTLSDGGNVTKGDRLTYDLTSGEATIEVGKSAERVHGLIIPGSSNAEDPDKPAAPKKESAANAADKPKSPKKPPQGDPAPKP